MINVLLKRVSIYLKENGFTFRETNLLFFLLPPFSKIKTLEGNKNPSLGANSFVKEKNPFSKGFVMLGIKQEIAKMSLRRNLMVYPYTCTVFHIVCKLLSNEQNSSLNTHYLEQESTCKITECLHIK